ncbi:MAG: hypothetical protein ABIO70_10710 [Pseudomonadota bacterium]
MRVVPLLLLPVLAAGCRKVPPAPVELDELCGYLFAHFDDEYPDAMQEGLYNLDVWLLANLEETLEGYSVTSLSEETINALDDRARNPDDMIGAAVGTESIYTPYALGVPQVVDDQEDLFPDSHDYYDRTYLTDTDCFVEQKCEDAAVQNYIEDTYPIIGSVITHNHGQYRWVETELGTAWVQRTWFDVPAELEVDWIDIQDQYYLNVLLPQEHGTLTLQSMWIEATWDGLPVSENMAKNLLISQMQNIYTQMDAYIENNGARVEPRGCATSGSRGTWGLLALFGLGLLRRRRA